MPIHIGPSMFLLPSRYDQNRSSSATSSNESKIVTKSGSHRTRAAVLGAVRELVGIESGVVSGLSNPNDSGVATPVETTPWEAITRRLPRYIRQLGRAPNFLTTGSPRLKWAYGRSGGTLAMPRPRLTCEARS